MARAKKMTENDKMLLLWALSKRNEAIDRYTKAVREYCLTSRDWDAVLEAGRNANRNGVSNDTLIEIDIEVMNSITDEELLEAIGEL